MPFHLSPGIVSVIAALGLGIAGCGGGEAKPEPPVAARTTAARPDSSGTARQTLESGGEVVAESTTAATRAADAWLSDANIMALLATVNGRQIAAAEALLMAWHSDTVKTLALSMIHDHSELARSIDSVSTRIKLAPVTPALAQSVSATIQRQIDSMRAIRGAAFDRAYVRQAIASHESMANFVAQLGAIAERPEVQGLMSSAKTRVAAQLARAKSVNAMLAAGDSLATADSAAKAEARRKRTSRVP